MKKGEKLREIFFEGEFTDANTYINKERTSRHLAAQIKQEETLKVQYGCMGVLPVSDYPVFVEFHWQCKDQKKDPDNIAFAKKFILDGLQAGRVLEGDGWKHIAGFGGDYFAVKPNDVGVIVVIYKAEE